MAIVAMKVFLRTKMHQHSVVDGVVFLGALFFSLVKNKGGLMYLGPKTKIDYLVLDTKLLLINMNYVNFFSFFRNFIGRKSLTKFFILVNVTD